MRANMRKVLEAFAHGRSATGDSRGSCSTDGMTVYSYSMPIARRGPNGIIYVVHKKHSPSVTTSTQMGAVRGFFHGQRVVEVSSLATIEAHASRARVTRRRFVTRGRRSR